MRATQITMFGEPKAKRLAEEDTPTYRIGRLGANALSFPELIAVLINDSPEHIEIAEAVAEKYHDVASLLKATDHELTGIRGLGPKRSARIRAALGMMARMNAWNPEKPPAIHSPADAAELVKLDMMPLEQEELWVILLDTRNRVIEIDKTYKGSVNSIQVRAGELFKKAIKISAMHIIIVHNHPSGDATPSPDDVALTRTVVQAGKLLDIDVLDHLVIGKNQWVSLKDRGLGFS